jgi:nanoRNase/pAp phosphatase (c-di-AMP/oligoRNAs hydrolase)
MKNPNLSDFGTIFLFDFNGYDQLGKLGSEFKKIVSLGKIKVTAFDHHVVEKESIDTKGLFVGKAFSTTQLLFDLFKKDFSPKMFFYACIGILEDTGHFIVGDKKLFNDFSFCLDKSKTSYADVLLFSKHTIPNDEKIAFLKAAQRANIIQIKDAIVVTSELSFYQSPAASKLLDFGADISLVAGVEEKNGLTTLSARADSVFKEKYKFNLVKNLLFDLQKEIGGEIGGHSGAAQWKGHKDPKEVLSLCVESIKNKMWIKSKI